MKRSALILVCAVLGTDVLLAQTPGDPHPLAVADAAVGPTVVTLLAGRSTLIDAGHPIARVSLTSPDVADALEAMPVTPTPTLSAAAFMRIMAALLIRFSRRCSARNASG